MEIKSYKHKGLKALAEASQPRNVKGVPADFSKKLHQQLTFIQSAPNIRALATMPLWKVHELTPKYPGKWSMWVSGNYRLTFRLDPATNTVTDIDLEDYH